MVISYSYLQCTIQLKQNKDIRKSEIMCCNNSTKEGVDALERNVEIIPPTDGQNGDLWGIFI